jgi:putative phosphoribosyl transferase
MDHALRRKPSHREEPIHIAPPGLEGTLVLPAEARGVVVFAHGSGSSRFSPRNRHVAAILQDAGLATLLFDLLREDEAHDRKNVFDIALIARRLEVAVDVLAAHPACAGLQFGLFGASTGAAAALTAAAARPLLVHAVVSRGGRPDLTDEETLARVGAPTLLIVGGADPVVLQCNRWARERLACESELVVVPGATHLFEEPGTLDEVARQAATWFRRWLGGESRHAPR